LPIGVKSDANVITVGTRNKNENVLFLTLGTLITSEKKAIFSSFSLFLTLDTLISVAKVPDMWTYQHVAEFPAMSDYSSIAN
jgi:hypothetical protein